MSQQSIQLLEKDQAQTGGNTLSVSGLYSATINAVFCLALLLFEVTTLLAWEFITKMWKVVSFIVSEALTWLNWTESSVEYTVQCSCLETYIHTESC